MTYASLFEFTEFGLAAFQRVFTGQLAEEAINLSDPAVAKRIDRTRSLNVVQFPTAKDLAAAVLSAIGDHSVVELVPRTGLWAWLTFVLRDELFPKDAAGRRKFGEVHRWYPSSPNDWQKGQRHLVRMPVQLLSSLGRNSDHLLCGAPSILPEIREQLTSQQDMFHPTFQGAARTLYFDDEARALKRGTAGKGGGSARRLAQLRKQLDVTWDLYGISATAFVELLPEEFDRFRKSDAKSPATAGRQNEARAQNATSP